jgi:ligand-binding sensor domain-containing protein/HPt (histidine-containing phosphotransfer) domain-containing protein
MKRMFSLSLLTQIFIFTAISIFKVYGQAKQLQFKYLTTDDGLSSSSAISILQDYKGFIWIGTYDGLNRYDGFNFLVYKNDPVDSTSLSGNLVRTIFEDHNNNLFIGTQNSLCLYEREKDHFINYSLEKSSPLREIRCTVLKIAEDSLGNLWLATNIGLIYFDRLKNQIIQYTHDPDNPVSLSNNDLESVFIDTKNRLWITTRRGLNLFQPETGTFSLITQSENGADDLASIFFIDITEDREGNLWFGSTDGLFCLRNNSGKKNISLTHYQHNPRDKHSLSNNRVKSLYVDDVGNLWIGTENGGVNLFDRKNQRFWHYRIDEYNPKSLNNESIQAIYQDNTGNLWVCTFTGGLNIAMKNSDAIIHYKNLPGAPFSLSHNVITYFLEDHLGQLWVGTDGGGINLFNNETNRFLRFNMANSSMSSNAILCIIEDSKNSIWLGTWAGGLMHFNSKTQSFRSFTTQNSSIPDNNIYTIAEGDHDDLWLGSFENGLIHYEIKENRFTNYTTDNSGLHNNMIVTIRNDFKGCLYLGTTNGFQFFSPVDNRFITYMHDPDNRNSVSDPSILDILVENDTCVWIGTQNGLNRFNPNTGFFKRYYEKDGLPNNVIKGIVLERSGILWVTTNNGVCRFDYRKGEYKNYTKDDGLQSNEFNQRSVLKTKSGAFLMGGTNGFNLIYPEKITKNMNVPPVLITDFRIFNKPVKIAEDNSPLKKHISETKELLLSYKLSVFTFHFNVMDFTMPEKNQYAFIMQGFEKEWNYVGSKREATYTNLDPGEYIFRVKGSNNDGIWNEQGTSIKIIITPPFWQTWWFRILMILFIIMAIYIIYKIRVRNIEAHRRELAIKVEERTHELKKANIEIGKKANELEKSYKDLAIAKKETDNILHNVEEGFFLLDHEYKISSQYSSVLETIFSRKEIAHLNLLDFCSDKITESDIENTRMYLEFLFDEKVNENSILHLNPLVDLEFIFSRENRSGNENDPKISKYLNFSFKRIRSDENKIIELIVTVRDVTRSILLAKQLKEEEARRERLLQLMLGILDVEPEMLIEFSESAQRELAFIDQIMNHEKIEDYQALLVKVHRAMHLIKGNAKLLNIDYFAQAAHQFEDLISEVQKKRKITPKDIEPLRVKLRELETGIEEMEKIIEKMGQVLTHKGGKKKTDARSLLLSLENLIKSFSSDLGKKIKFNYKKFKSQIIPSRYHLLVKEVLIQLIRNSISHGIEFPEERKRLKKPQYGKIEISTFKKNGSIGFRLRDDGRGIQIKKLKEKALQSGKWDKEEIEKWDDNKIAELIFTSGISTAERVDMIAGRGVGMDGVIHRLKEYRGEIQVSFTEGQYCEFEVILPAVI